MKVSEMKDGMLVWIETSKGRQMGYLETFPDKNKWFVSRHGNASGWWTTNPEDITEVEQNG